MAMLARLAKWYLNLAPVVPPDYYLQSRPLQRAQMEFDSEATSEGFHRIFDLNIIGKDVLDLGCGHGGRTVYYKQLGARSVACIEIAQPMVGEALAFARKMGVEIDARVGCGEQIPFLDSSFDAITSYDVFEHVESVERTLAECHRVLRGGGTLYAAFPPYYHPTGGSHLHGYLSSSPAPNLLFSTDVLQQAIEMILDERGTVDRPPRRVTDPLPSVNGTTVAGFLKTLGATAFSKQQVTLQPLKYSRLPMLEWIPKLGVKLPLVREVCTSRIMCVFTK